MVTASWVITLSYYIHDAEIDENIAFLKMLRQEQFGKKKGTSI